MDNVEDCKNFSELQGYYRRKTEEIAATTALMAKYSDISSILDEDRTVLNEICTDLGKSQKLLIAVNTEKEKLAYTLACNKVTLARLDVLKERFQEQQENIPKHMPTPASRKEEEENQIEQIEQIDKPISRPETKKSKLPCVRFEEEKPAIKTIKTRQVASAGSKIPSKNKKQKLSRTTIVPLMNFLTTEEFKSLPKYMVGRTKYDLINSMIEELNTVTVSKYKIIDSPVNKLNSENMRRFNRMTAHPETKDTAGMVWFEVEDVKDFASVPTLAPAFLKMVPILRHCHRLRQVRAGKVERYIVLL